MTSKNDLITIAYSKYLQHEQLKLEVNVLKSLLYDKKIQLKILSEEVHQSREHFNELCGMKYKGRNNEI